MNKHLIYPIGVTDSCHIAAAHLQRSGIPLTDHPSPDVTHLLLDVPSFQMNALLQGGEDLQTLLRMLPKTITLIGGNLEQDFLKAHPRLDLLKDPYYLARNARITAECALRVAAPYLNRIYAESSALILGWGRIGKNLARILSALGCQVTVAARKECDRAILETFGYNAIDFSEIPRILKSCTILFNTVPNLPHNIFDAGYNGISIDLASLPGMQGAQVIPARGLPGKYAPESTGKLIAETILRMNLEGVL